MRPRNFALDIDGTFTADPSLFAAIVRLIVQAGHKVAVVSMRTPLPNSEAEEVLQWMQEYGVKDKIDRFFFTDRKAKQPWMEQNHPDYPIHIWMDDKPKWLLNDA